MHLCDICFIAPREHLAVDTAAADNKHLFCPGSCPCRFLRAMADCKTGDLNILPCQHDIGSSRQWLLSGKIRHSFSAGDHRSPTGRFPEKFPIGRQCHRLSSIPTDAPILIYRNEISISHLKLPWGSQTQKDDTGSLPL